LYTSYPETSRLKEGLGSIKKIKINTKNVKKNRQDTKDRVDKYPIRYYIVFIERIIMNQHFIIRYKVEDDIPVCPDHILNELKTHVEIIQSKIDAKNLFGKHTLELREVKEGWFEKADDSR
jgi:hypothetical protein